MFPVSPLGLAIKSLGDDDPPFKDFDMKLDTIEDQSSEMMFDAQEEAFDDQEFQNVSESYELNDEDL